MATNDPFKDLVDPESVRGPLPDPTTQPHPNRSRAPSACSEEAA